jgi:hypothetical protein
MNFFTWLRLGKSSSAVSRRKVRKSGQRRNGFRLRIERLEERMTPSGTDVWTGANYLVDNNWSDGSNWSLLQPPGTGDVADFTSGAQSSTSNVDTAFTIAGLTIDGSWGGTINVNNALSVTGKFALSSGVFGGNGAVSIAGSSSLWNGGQINGGTGGFTNSGTFTIDTTNGNLTYSGAGTLTNNGTIDESGNKSLSLNNGAMLSNTGTYDFTYDCSITESGGGTLSNTYPGIVEKTGANWAIHDSSGIDCTFNNTGGTLDDVVGDLFIGVGGGAINGANLEVSPVLGTLGFLGQIDCQGLLTGSGAGHVEVLRTLTITSAGATFNMPGNLFQWEGTIDVSSGGTLTNASGSVLNVVTSPGGVPRLNGAGTLTNNGTIYEYDFYHEGGGVLDLANGATLTNTGTYDFRFDSKIYGSGSGGTLNNTGTVEKTDGSGTSAIYCTFNNTGGTVDAYTGTLQLGSSGLINGATLGFPGTDTKATINLGSEGFQGLVTGSGTGKIMLTDGSTLSVASAGTTFNMVNMAGNGFQWTGGTIDVSSGGTFTCASTGTLNLNTALNNLILNGAGTLINEGTIKEFGDNSLVLSNGATLSNSGTYNVEGDSGITESSGGTFSNTGKVLVTTGTMAISSTVAQVSGATLTAGAWGAINGSLDITSAGNLTTIGSQARVMLSGTQTSFANISSLATILAGGGFALAGGANFTTVGPLANNGALRVGPASVLTISGSFTDATSAVTAIQLGGTSSAPTFGQIVSTTDSVSLAGKLSVVSTMVPAVGSSFEIVNNQGSNPVSGTFAGLPEGATFTVTVGSTTVTFQISYLGGDGNDVVITPLPPGDVWTGANYLVDDNWSDGLNWSLLHPPGAGDIVDFTSGAQSSTSNVDAVFTIAGLTIDGGWGGTINVNNALSVTGKFALSSGVFGGNGAVSIAGPSSQWNGGQINAGTGGFTNSGTLTIATTKNNLTYSGAGTLTNSGIIREFGSNSLVLDGGATLSNIGTYNVGSDGGIAGSNGGTFVNSGTLEKTGGYGTTSIACSTLNNAGTVMVTSGTMEISATVTQVSGDALTAGTWCASSGTPNVSATLNITSAGNLTTIGSQARVILGARSSFPNISSLATISAGGIFNLAGGANFTTLGALTNNGTLKLGQANVLTVSGSFTDTSTAVTVLQMGGTSFSQIVSTTGTVALAGTLSFGSTVVPAVGSSFVILNNEGSNPVTGTFEGLPEGGAFAFTVGSTLRVFRITYLGGDGNDVVITCELPDVWTGANYLVDNNWSDGSNWSLLQPPGTGDVADFTSGAQSSTSNVDTAFTIAGLTIDSRWNGTINVNSALSLTGNFALSSGTFGGNGAVSIAGPSSVWNGGQINGGAGGFTNSGTLGIVTAKNSLTFNGAGTLTNSGTIDEVGGNFLYLDNGAVLSNTGTYDLTNDSSITESGGGSFVNSGTLEKTGGTGTTSIACSTLDNTGSVLVTTGTMAISATVTQVSGTTLTAGSWTASSTPTGSATLDITAAGSLTTIGSQALVTLSGSGASFPNLSSLATISAGGSLDLAAGASFTTVGDLTNDGTLTVGPASALIVSGSFTDGSTAVTAVQIGGTSSAPTFGQIFSTTGTVAVAGTLSVGSTVVPAVGSSFEIVNNEGANPITGTFAGLTEGSTFIVDVGSTPMTFQITYLGGDGNDVVITRIS